MLDLARILAAVTAVTERPEAVVTPKDAPTLVVTAVTVVTAPKGDDATRRHTVSESEPGAASRASRFDCNCRNCRNPSNGAPCAVTARTDSPVTAVTGTGRTTWGAPLPPPLPFVRCAECEHFRRNKDNPLAGVGRCRLGHPDGPGNMPQYPDAPRLCGSFRDDSG